MFSNDFGSGNGSSVANLNRTFTGDNVGVEVYQVASEALTAAELCASLKNQNQGKDSRRGPGHLNFALPPLLAKKPDQSVNSGLELLP